MKIRLIKSVFICFIFFLFTACEWEGYQTQNENNSGNETDQQEMGRQDRWRKVKYLAAVDRAASSMRNNIGLWSYETGYEWLEGESFREDEQLEIKLLKFADHIEMELIIDVSEFQPYPTVWDPDFRKNDDADYLRVQVDFTNNKNGKKFSFHESSSISSSGRVRLDFEISADDLAKISVGMVNFTANIKTEFVSFFGVKSGKKPILAKIETPYKNPSFYHYTFHFKSITLNKGETARLLGNNDWNNSAPETALTVGYGGVKRLYFGHAKNSYSYQNSGVQDIFTVDSLIKLDINAVDADYGFNGNDVICDTLIPISHLLDKKYQSISMKCVDELLIRAEYKGRANK